MTEKAADKVDFSSLVAGLAASAVAVLSRVEALLETGVDPAGAASDEGATEPLAPDELKKRVTDGLGGARHLIDTLAVLEEKTKGNLTDAEKELLLSALSELRIRFVSLANRPVREPGRAGDTGGPTSGDTQERGAGEGGAG
jgi:hypothetical protein